MCYLDSFSYIELHDYLDALLIQESYLQQNYMCNISEGLQEDHLSYYPAVSELFHVAPGRRKF